MSTTLAAAVRAAEKGRKEEALLILRGLSESRPDDEAVFSWLAYVTDDNQERIEALVRIVELNPGRKDVREWLARNLSGVAEVDHPELVDHPEPLDWPTPVAEIGKENSCDTLLIDRNGTQSTPVAAGFDTVRPSRGRSRPHVLLVERDPAVGRLTAIALQRYGCSVDVVADDHEALDRAGRHRPQLVLVDASLTDADAYELARLLRQRTAATTVLLTGRPQESFDVDRARSVGVDGLFRKPYSPQSMALLLGRYLSGSDADATPV